MFVVGGTCLLCKEQQTPIRKHWCMDSQIVIGLLLLQHKFIGGNIHSSQLRDALMSDHIGMSPSRATKTMRALRTGNKDACKGCYDPDCPNFTCTHVHNNKCAKKCRHVCLYDGCSHHCSGCDDKCEEGHSYFTTLVDVLDPRRSKIWISTIGLEYLDIRMDDLVINNEKLEYESIIEGVCVLQ